MSIKRRAAKRDANEAEIIEVLRAAGATVAQLSETSVPDLLIGFRGANFLAEVKMPTGKLKPGQSEFIDHWQGQVAVIRTVGEALFLIGVIE